MPLIFGGRNFHLGGSLVFRRVPSLLAKISSTFISCAFADSDSAQLASPMDLPCALGSFHFNLSFFAMWFSLSLLSVLARFQGTRGCELRSGVVSRFSFH